MKKIIYIYLIRESQQGITLEELPTSVRRIISSDKFLHIRIFNIDREDTDLIIKTEALTPDDEGTY